MSDKPQYAPVPLIDQAEEAHRELCMRHRVYPGLVKRGKMTADDALEAIDKMRAIERTLRLFAEYEPVIRGALENAIAARRIAETDPAARALIGELDAVPAELRIMGSSSDPGEQEGWLGNPAVEGSTP